VTQVPESFGYELLSHQEHADTDSEEDGAELNNLDWDLPGFRSCTPSPDRASRSLEQANQIPKHFFHEQRREKSPCPRTNSSSPPFTLNLNLNRAYIGISYWRNT
jgi:hypothetical protein